MKSRKRPLPHRVAMAEVKASKKAPHGSREQKIDSMEKKVGDKKF